MARRGWWRRGSVALAAGLAALLAVGPGAAALEDEDFTGDITPPRLTEFSITPGAGDVTTAAKTFTVRARVVDDWSGGVTVDASMYPPSANVSYGIFMPRVSGDDHDGVYEGTFTVRRYSEAGFYEVNISIGDRVGNYRSSQSGDLIAAGYAGGVDVTDSDPDTTPPRVTGLRVTPSVVDVRDGPAEVTIEVDVADDQVGMPYGPALFTLGPDQSGGGVEQNGMVRVTGTNHQATYRVTRTLPRYTRHGRWQLFMVAHDELFNSLELRVPDLAAMNLPTGFDVLSEPDLQPPAIVDVDVWPIEVNVHDADQVVTARLRVTDNLAGVADRPYLDNLHDITFEMLDPVTNQFQGVSGIPRVSGDALDGQYEARITIPKSSATGLRSIGYFTNDEVANQAYFGRDQIVALGGVPAILVYNVPLPPLPVRVVPGDGEALIEWEPPLDDRGAEITDYVIEELPQGIVVEVPVPPAPPASEPPPPVADTLTAVIDGLTNDIEHTFTIKAVNKAGLSDPSRTMLAVPTGSPPPVIHVPASGQAPSSGGPAPAPAPSPPSPVGYWMVEESGAVHAFGQALHYGERRSTATTVDIETPPTGRGYWVLDASGQVVAFGDAQNLGGATVLAPGERATSLSATQFGRGYWLFTNKGRVLTFGDADFFGDLVGIDLNAPVLESVATPTGRGYYLVAGDGGVFTFGDASFAGSMGDKRLNAPVESLVPDPDGVGYWLVAGDGGIFAFDAPFYGSMGSVRLNRPVTGMVGYGAGYLMVAEDGGIFAFGDAVFSGSLGDSPPPTRIAAVGSIPR